MHNLSERFDFEGDQETYFDDDSSSNEGWLTSFGDLMSLLLVFFILLMSASKVSQIKFEQIKNSVSGRDLEGEVDLVTLSENLKNEIKVAGLDKKVSVDLTDDAVKLIFHESLLFSSGKADLIQENIPLVRKIIALLHAVPEYAQIVVEGHTDNVPIRSYQFRNNWELSSARALAVVQEIINSGFPGKRISLQGYGSYRPIAPNTDEDDKPIEENQKKNRRVVIKVF